MKAEDDGGEQYGGEGPYAEALEGYVPAREQLELEGAGWRTELGWERWLVTGVPSETEVQTRKPGVLDAEETPTVPVSGSDVGESAGSRESEACNSSASSSRTNILTYRDSLLQ